MKKYFIVFASMLIFVACGGSENSEMSRAEFYEKILGDENPAADDVMPATTLIAAGETFDITVELSGLTLAGDVTISAVEDTGSFDGTFTLSALGDVVEISGEIAGSSFTVDDFTVSHAMVTGTVMNLMGSIAEDGESATATFDFYVTASSLVDFVVGETLSGELNIARGSEAEDVASGTAASFSDFTVIGEPLEVAVSIYSFAIDATVTLASYDSSTGEFTGTFSNTAYDIAVDMTGRTSSDQSIAVDPFAISCGFVAGNVSNMAGEFDEATGTIMGSFDFEITESSVFEQYVGLTLGGSFTVSL